MNRRNTIKMLAGSIGLIALPSWAVGWSKKELIVGEVFQSTELELLSSVTDTIIPMGNSIGALSVGVDKFLQKLISDCYTTDIQDNVKLQLLELDKSAQADHGKSFPTLDQKQREDLLLKLSASEDKAQKDFFNLMKSETIRGFNTSREVMVNYLKYKMVPGHYHGCVDVNA